MRDLLYLKDDQIKDFIEQIFYVYRDTYSDPRKILKKYSFGTAHHRAIHLIERHEGLTVSDLLNKLKITKQSLNRVLRDLLYLKDDQIKDFIEQIFYAYKETYSDPKKILKKYSFGTAHHRAIQLIERHEGLTVSELLNKLKITKQSLNRVLRDLVKNKAILLKKGEVDSRQRQIFLDEKGKKLFEEIFLEQKKRIYNALKSSDADSVIKFKNILKKIINE